MIICLDCRALWPAGSFFCGVCGGSFGGRRCPKAHLSPANCERCLTCGSDELTPTARSLDLKPVVTLASLASALLLCSLLFSHIGQAFGATGWLLGGLCHLVTGRYLDQVVYSLLYLLFITALPFIFVRLMFPKSALAARLPSIYFKLWRSVALGVWGAVKFLLAQSRPHSLSRQPQGRAG